MLVGVDGQAELLRTLTRDWAIAEHNAPKLVRANLRLTEPWTVRIRAIDTRVREGGGRTGAVYNTDASLRVPIRFRRVACYSYDCVAQAADQEVVKRQVHPGTGIRCCGRNWVWT